MKLQSFVGVCVCVCKTHEQNVTLQFGTAVSVLRPCPNFSASGSYGKFCFELDIENSLSRSTMKILFRVRHGKFCFQLDIENSVSSSTWKILFRGRQ